MAPIVAQRVSAAGAASVRFVLQPLVLVFGLGEQAKSPAFWAAYDVLAGLPIEALEAGVKDYLAHPDSQFFPKPGPLKAHCDKHAAPLLKAAYRLGRAASLKPDHRPPPSPEQRAAIRRMADEAMRSLKDASARAWPKRMVGELPSIAGKTDEGGLTREMRELIARRVANGSEHSGN